MFREIRRTARPGEVNDVANAVGTATEAMAEGEVERAVELLEWAKTKAPRSISIREGLGVALYLAADFDGAQRELQAYKRMSGRMDQNHLLADAARALERPDRVVELVDEMASAHADGKVPLDRLIEGIIVQAGMLSDSGRPEEALGLLDRAPLPEGGASESHGRAWYAAAEIALQMGDQDQAIEYFRAASTVEDDFLDAESRIEELGG